MRYSDIRVGNIYFINLEPVRRYEFGGNHLGIVLSKGNDQRTVTIVSLTSNSSGNNKLNIGIIPSLPQRLVEDKNGNPLSSYVVLDQVRTIVSNRVQGILDGKDYKGNDNIIECPITPDTYSLLVSEITNVTISNLNDEDKILEYFETSFLNLSITKMINLAYDIIKGQGEPSEKEKEIRRLYGIIVSIKNDFSFKDHLVQADKEYKIPETISEIVSDKINV